MFNERIMAIIKREIRAQIMSKTFIIMTVLMPVIWFGLIGLQTFVMSYESDDKVFLQIVTEDAQLTTEVEKQLNNEDFVKKGQFSIDYRTVNKSELNRYIEGIRKSLISKDISGIFFVSDSSKYNKKIDYYSTNPKNRDVTSKIRSTINDVLVKNYFTDKNISDEDLTFAQKRVSINGIKVTKSGFEEDGFGNIIVAGIFTFLLFLSIVIIGQSLMQAVTEEKTNRVVEVLLSSVNSTELMTGKIIGTAATGLLQMLVWTSPFILLSLGSLPMLDGIKGLNLNISPSLFPYFFINYIIGLITYLSLYAAFGAIFDNPQEAQQGIWPLMMLILIPFYMSFAIFKNPSNIIAELGSMLPFSSIMLMPARMTLIDLPWWQPTIALAVNLTMLILILLAVGKIYKIGIMTTGKRPKWSEIIRWVKQQ